MSSRSSSRGSSASSPSSHFSDLSVPESTATSQSSGSDTILPHYVLAHPLCSSLVELDLFLRSLPLTSSDDPTSKHYLLLTLNHGEKVDGTTASSKCGKESLSDSVRSMAALLGNETMFKNWTWVSSERDAEDGGMNRPRTGYYKPVEDGENSSSVCLQDIEDRELPYTSSKLIAHNEALNVFASSSLHLILRKELDWGSPSSTYLLESAPFSFPSLKPLAPLCQTASDSAEGLNPFGPPTRDDWRRLWAAWDLVTLGMISPSMLHQKPIDLRHKCLFYIGHIPTFLNILLSRLLKEPYTEPKNFTQIFERGIDPHVDDPDHCHSHSEVPEADEDWPSLAAVLSYRDRVRARLMAFYYDLECGKRTMNRRTARVLQMTLEHEGFHVETLLYMLIQRAGSGTLPPPGFTQPPWAELAAQWDRIPAPPAASVALGPARLVLGHDDSELDDLTPGLSENVAAHAFGWDNESPRRVVDVPRFKIDWRPISNGDFYAFWKVRKGTDAAVALPASWTDTEGNISVRTVYGELPLQVAKHWPVLASYDDLQDYAQSKGGHIPTEPELRLFLDAYNTGFDDGANVGFRNWHPIPATAGLDGKAGTNGGVWEWTSTPFDGHDGLAPTSIFPGYSSDFFDGKHHVVLGASYATIPRLSERRTLRNFYQHNYPYAWVGGRVAYDA